MIVQWLLVLVLAGFLAAGAAEAAKPGALPTYTVRKGDTLLGIARKTGVKAKELKRLNHLKSNLIQPGQMLVLGTGPKLPPRKQVKPLAASPAPLPPAPVTAAEAGPTVAPAPEPAAPALAAAPVPQADPVPVAASTPTSDPGLPQASVDLQQVALAYLSTPYRFGAENRKSTDCSGFTQQVFRECGLDLPRTAREQFAVGAVVPDGEWQIGDLLFFRTYARYPSHVGIYLGDGKMIHASRSHRKVVISSVERPYFRKRFLGARRVVWFDPVASLIDNLADKIEVVDEVNEEGLFESDLAVPPVQETAPVQPDAVSAPLSPQA